MADEGENLPTLYIYIASVLEASNRTTKKIQKIDIQIQMHRVSKNSTNMNLKHASSCSWVKAETTVS
jgi:hypothetical protein